MDSLIYIVPVVLFIIGITVLYNRLKKKDIVSDGDVNVVINAINIAKNIINDLELNNKAEKTIHDILDAADAVAEYVHNLGQVTEVNDKKSLATDVVNEILSIIRAPIADKDKDLIKIVIDESLKVLDSKDKV